MDEIIIWLYIFTHHSSTRSEYIYLHDSSCCLLFPLLYIYTYEKNIYTYIYMYLYLYILISIYKCKRRYMTYIIPRLDVNISINYYSHCCIHIYICNYIHLFVSKVYTYTLNYVYVPQLDSNFWIIYPATYCYHCYTYKHIYKHARTYIHIRICVYSHIYI